MVQLVTSLALLSATFVTTAFALPNIYPSSSAAARAVYFMSNNEALNTIHSLPVSGDGTVSYGMVTPTGGKGSRAPASMLTDALNSQGSVRIMGNMLLCVNAGSNTISMFSIDPYDPLKLNMIGAPVDSMGDFPNTIAVSEKLRMACVANSGTRSGIACFRVTSHGLKSLDHSIRPLTLTPTQPTPPNGPFNTVSQTFFSADQSALLTTVKGDPMAKPPTTGYLSYFPVVNGMVSRTETRSSPNGTAVLFGSVPLPSGRVFTTDASFGAALLAVNPQTHDASLISKYVVPNNAATCWLTQSPTTGDVYITDDGVNQIVRLNAETGEHIATILLPNGNNAMIEIQPAGSLLYALCHGNATVRPHVIVMNTAVGDNAAVSQIQNFAPGYGKLNINVEGMAILLNKDYSSPCWRGLDGGWSQYWDH